LWLALGGGSWGVQTSVEGGWSIAIKQTEYTKWTEQDRDNKFSECMRRVNQLLIDAKVDSVDKLLGIPIEAKFDGNQLTEWRILKEVL
jgi:hypothetical protein